MCSKWLYITQLYVNYIIIIVEIQLNTKLYIISYLISGCKRGVVIELLNMNNAHWVIQLTGSVCCSGEVFDYVDIALSGWGA